MSVRAWAWRHPEWWAIGLSALAWVALARPGGHGSAMAAEHGMTMGGGMDMGGGMAMGHEMASATTRADVASMFGLMVVAMMLPATIGPVRDTASRSLWRRRGRAVAEHLAGYLVVWALAGVAALGVWSVVSGRAAAAVGLGIAAAWQLTPVKRRAVAAHSRARPLAPSGWRADRDCVAFGCEAGWRCVVSCGPMMGAMALGPVSLPAMGALTVVVLAERRRYRPPLRAGALVLAAVAVAVAAS